MATTRDMARVEFWKAVERHAPAVAESLATEVLPLWLEASRAGRPNHSGRVMAAAAEQLAATLGLFRGLRGSGQYEGLSEAETDDLAVKEWAARWPNHDDPLTIALARWADRWGLRTGWCIEHASWTLCGWEKDSAKASRREWHSGAPYTDTWAGEFEFKFEMPWRPEVETWAAYRAAVNQAFQARLTEHRKKLLAERRGRLLAYTPSADHYGWLVRLHINGESFGSIAKGRYSDTVRKRRGIGAARPDVKTVRVAVRALAELIGLPLREIKQGRPVKQKTG